MTLPTRLRDHSPKELGAARAATHQAVQFATRAARANLPVQPDDSHSNLGWDSSLGGFLTQPIVSGGATYHVAVGFTPLRLVVLRDQMATASLDLAGKSVSAVSEWLGSQLKVVGLHDVGGINLPYKLPPEVAEISAFDSEDPSSIGTLSAWFQFADSALGAFVGSHSEISPGPSPVRCWPHHFDIASYVALESGDPESARGIGVGMSPGDESYDEPYFYINPWPHLETVGLPDLPAPGHWHTEGFVGMVVTASEFLAAPEDLDPGKHIGNLFGIGRGLQKC